MWTASVKNSSSSFMTPQPPTRKSRMSAEDSPMQPYERKTDPFHVVHKVPSGDSPYVKAKHVQLIDKEPSKAIALFWAAINAGDRVDSALKDMAIVMKQLNRSDEAIEAIKSFRHLCPYDSQESIDNVLIELYKRAGRIEEEIEMLQRKLKRIEEGAVFSGRRTKTARSQGKKVQVTIHQERSRVLGNLGWAYMQLKEYETANELYRKALILEPDNNKQSNLAICLMHMNRIAEAEAHLQPVMAYAKTHRLDESCAKSFDRALQLLSEVKSKSAQDSIDGRFFLPDSVECRTSVNGGQGYVPVVEAYEKLKNRQDAEVKLLKRGPSCQDYQHIVDSGICGNEANVKYASCRPQSQQFSSQSNSWENGCYMENLEKKDKVLGQNQESSSSIAQPEVISASRKAHAPKRRIFNAPSTQPKKRSWESKYGREKRYTWTENAGRNLSRRLCFEESFPSDSSQIPTKNAYKQDPKIFDTDCSMKGSETSLLSAHNMCRERPRGGFGQLQHAVRKPNSQVLVNNRWTQEQNEAEKSQTKQRIQQMFDFKLPVDETGVMKTTAIGKSDHCSNETAPGNMGLKEIVEEIWSKQDHTGKSDFSWNSQATMHIDHSKSSKSWADLVEEEEQELSMGCYGDICQEPSDPLLKHFESLSFIDEFSDENRDSNIRELDHSIDQEEYLSQKRQELLDLVDGECAPQRGASSRRSTVKRHINFSRLQKCDSEADSIPLYPCLRSSLNSEKRSSLPDMKTNFVSAKCAQPKRKHRLQVFCDITPQPESPGA